MTQEAGRLPESVDREIALVHAEGCQCAMWGEPEKGSRCFEAREILRAAILHALDEARACCKTGCQRPDICRCGCAP